MNDQIQTIALKALDLINYLPFHFGYNDKTDKFIKLGLCISPFNSKVYEFYGIHRCPQIRKLDSFQIECIAQKCIQFNQEDLIFYISNEPKYLLSQEDITSLSNDIFTGRIGLSPKPPTDITIEDLISRIDHLNKNIHLEIPDNPLDKSLTKIITNRICYNFVRPQMDKVMDDILKEGESPITSVYIERILRQAILEHLGDEYPNIWKIRHSTLNSDLQVDQHLLEETQDLNQVKKFIQSLTVIHQIWIVPHQSSNILDDLNCAYLYNTEHDVSFLPTPPQPPSETLTKQGNLAQCIALDALCLLSYLPYREKADPYNRLYPCYISLVITLKDTTTFIFYRDTPKTWKVKNDKEVVVENVEDLDQSINIIKSLKNIQQISILPRLEPKDQSLLTEKVEIYDRTKDTSSFSYIQMLKENSKDFQMTMKTLLAEPPRERTFENEVKEVYFPGGIDYIEAMERLHSNKDQ